MTASDTTARGYTITTRGSQNISMGREHPFNPPTITDPYKKRIWVKQHMAAVFRVFARKGFTEGTAGHISVRDPVDIHTFWINPLGVHFGLLKASDMVRVDYDGNIIDGDQSAVNRAGFSIHSALHKARPDVNAACHMHTTYGKAYSAFAKNLDMINQDACTFYKSIAVYEEFGGVAIDDREGIEIAAAIGQGKGAILRNHGLLTVGSTVDEAGYLFMLLEKTCEIQMIVDQYAGATGHKTLYAGDEEAKFTHDANADPQTLYTEFQPEYHMELRYGDDFLL